jgi:hypothetical protein
VLTMNDGRWQVGDLFRDDEVELNPGERLVDPHPVDFVRIGDALNRGNESSARVELRPEA